MARDDTRSKKRTVRKADGERIVVGSEIGVTIPVGDTTAHLRFSFWSERIVNGTTLAEIRKTAADVDEFNEAELDKHLRKHLRTVRRAMNGDDDEAVPKAKKSHKQKVSVRERAQGRMK